MARARAFVAGWADQDVVLYHGTVDFHVASILRGVDVSRGGPFKDFGRGFYTTTNRALADRWARELADVTLGGHQAVVSFDVSRNWLVLL